MEIYIPKMHRIGKKKPRPVLVRTRRKTPTSKIEILGFIYMTNPVWKRYVKVLQKQEAKYATEACHTSPVRKQYVEVLRKKA